MLVDYRGQKDIGGIVEKLQLVAEWEQFDL